MKILTYSCTLACAFTLAACNPQAGEGSGSDAELGLAKSFVQDFSGLQTSLVELETPVMDFSSQVEADFDNIGQAGPNALDATLEEVFEVLGAELESMVSENQDGVSIDFNEVTNTAFSDTSEVKFTNASYAITDTGTVTASGDAEVDGESVDFELELNLPAIQATDSGSVDYDLTANIDFSTSGGNLGLDVNNASGSLELELAGDRQVGDLTEGGQPEDGEIEALSLSVDESTLTLGGMTLVGSTVLSVFPSSVSDTDQDISFGLTTTGKLTNSQDDFLDVSVTLADTSRFQRADTGDATSEGWDIDINLGYQVSTELQSGNHNFKVTLNGDFVLDESYSGSTDGTWSESYDVAADGDVVITHNDAEFKMDYDFDGLFESSQNNGDSESIDLVLQDGTENNDTVVIVMGNFDDPDTNRFEFAEVRVNGTVYGDIADDSGNTVAHFTDGSSVVVFSDA